MQTIAEIIASQNYEAMQRAKSGRHQPKCRLIPTGSRLIRIA